MSRTVSQTINLQSPNMMDKYITEIDNNGISIHPENDRNNEIEISDNIIIKRNGAQVASYGENAISMFEELESIDKGLVVHDQATITGSLSAGATTMNGNSTVNGDLVLNGDLTTLNNLKLKFLVDPAANKTKAATSGEDMALFNWIRNLGWWDVIIE